jgi:Flp pilus assembly pilin Flp
LNNYAAVKKTVNPSLSLPVLSLLLAQNLMARVCYRQCVRTRKGDHMKKRINRGQSLVEYVALTALVAIVSIGTVKLFGGKVRTRLNQITTTFDRNVQQGLKTRANHSADDEDDGDDDQPELKLPKVLKLPKGLKLPHLAI